MLRTLVLAFAILFVSGCSNTVDAPLDFPEGKEPLAPIPTTTFIIDASEEVALEGAAGTTLFVLPGTFLDHRGRPITSGKIEITLMEAYSLADRVKLGATNKTADGQILTSEGIFYLEANHEGKPAGINADQPLYIETPEQGRSPEVTLYQGKWTDEGLIWTNPKPIPQYLIPFPFAELSYLPKDFAEAVQLSLAALPGHDTVTMELLDSLFLSLSGYHHNLDSTQQAAGVWRIFQKHTGELFRYHVFPEEADPYLAEWYSSLYPERYQMIDPAAVQAFRTPAFEESYLATREFAKRLQEIYRTGNPEILNIYLQHIEGNLWQADSLAATLWEPPSTPRTNIIQNLIQYSQEYTQSRVPYTQAGEAISDSTGPIPAPPKPVNPFQTFAQERLTNTESPPALALIQRHYRKRRAKLQRRSQKAYARYQEQVAKEGVEQQATLKAYNTLLQTRHEEHITEAVRRGAYIVETGFVNLGSTVNTKGLTVEGMPLDSTDRYHLYAFQEDWHHLFEGTKVGPDTWHFNVPIIMNPQSVFDISFIAVAYRDGNIYYGDEYISLGPNTAPLNFPILPVSPEELTQALAKYEPASAAQSLQVDLAFQQKMWEQDQQRRLRNYQRYLHRQLAYTLSAQVYPKE